MKTFKIDKFENVEIRCDWKKTRNGFKHEARLMVDNEERVKTKVCYLNRTWESFEYETVINKLLDISKIIPKDQKSEFLNKCRKNELDEVNANFGFIAEIAKLAEVFCENQKEKNDWKTRMLNAGLSDKGLIMPDDWNTLPEADKEARLNLVIKELSK